MAETGVSFPVVQASGEEIPLRAESFDLVFCGIMARPMANASLSPAAAWLGSRDMVTLDL